MTKKNEEIKSIAFAAETGSGKTLAYLLPIVHSLHVQESSFNFNSLVRKPKRPRALILAPTRELTEQILSVFKSISHCIKLSSTALYGGKSYSQQKTQLNRQIDVVITTPGRLIKHWKEGNVYLGGVDFVVIDEIDTMLNQGFQEDVAKILNPFLKRNKNEKSLNQGKMMGTQFILTTATMTSSVEYLLYYNNNTNIKLKDKPIIILPSNLRVLTTPRLHYVAPRLKQTFINVGNRNKFTILVDIISSRSCKMSNDARDIILVFCNTVISCQAVHHALLENGINSFSYHGELNSITRNNNLKLFRLSGNKSFNNLESTEPLPPVLVCTDIASRGLDILGVNHIIMFDFPLNSIDYLHRAGRTARICSNEDKTKTEKKRNDENKVTALVTRKDKFLALAIERAVKQGDPIVGLSSKKVHYLPGRRLRNIS